MIYLCSPYSHSSEVVRMSRFDAACYAAAGLMRKGKHVFSPVVHSHPIAMAGDLPLGWDYWEPFDRKMIAACDEIVVLRLFGWDQSRGVAAEIAIAQELGKPVSYIFP